MGGFAPFNAATLRKLYPTHKAYVRVVTRATDRAVNAGFLLPADARTLRTEAEASDVGRDPKTKTTRYGLDGPRASEIGPSETRRSGSTPAVGQATGVSRQAAAPTCQYIPVR